MGPNYRIRLVFEDQALTQEKNYERYTGLLSGGGENRVGYPAGIQGCVMALRTCVVSYHDLHCKYAVEVMAETLYEAVVLGIKAMNVRKDTLHLKSFDVQIKQPEVYREISGAMLSAWLAMPGKTAKEQELKDRLDGIMRG